MTGTDSAIRRVVGLGPVPAEVVTPILGPDFAFEGVPQESDLQTAEAAIVRAAVTLGEAEFAQMPRLRLVVRPGVGYDSIDLDAAQRAGVAVAITPGTNTNAVAEGAFAHILHLIKSLGPFTELMRRGGWDERVTHTVGDLEGATLGIIGFGRIGQRMRALADAFGMTVLAHDPVADIPTELRAEFDDLLAGSDIVSVHVPLLPETRNLISTAEIAAMRPGAVLINVSRGGIVDEDAAFEALQSGHLGGVGLDVFSPEPPPDHPLFHHEKVVLSPHMMGLSTRASRANYTAAAQTIRSFFGGGNEHTLVTDPQVDPSESERSKP